MAVSWRLVVLVTLALGLAPLVVARWTAQAGDATPAERGVLTYRPSTPAEVRAINAARAPQGFARSTRCFFAQSHEPCFKRVPSVVPTERLLARWTEETGLALHGLPARFVKPFECIHASRRARRRVTLESCLMTARAGRSLVFVSVDSIVELEHGTPRATRKWAGRRYRVRGTELKLLNIGVPER